jgi:DNA-directed RNA polymerase specialized sigma24 family protein
VRKSWTLTAEAFERLLGALDADRERAGEQYERLRARLVAFFDWRRAACPDDCADETLNVAARRLSEGEPVQNLLAYCYGIARMILHEQQRDQEQSQAALAELARMQAAADPDEDTGRRVFHQCLEQLPPESRNLLLAYYDAGQPGLVQARKVLARRLGVPLNALRIRAFRLRARLEGSVRTALEHADWQGK